MLGVRGERGCACGKNNAAVATLLNHLGQTPTPVGPARLSTLWREHEAATLQMRMRGMPKSSAAALLRYFVLDGTC